MLAGQALASSHEPLDKVLPSYFVKGAQEQSRAIQSKSDDIEGHRRSISTCNSSTRVDVLDFGAKGDGVTDDYAAIQAAIVTASHHPCGGGQVFFPPAVAYLVRQPLVIMSGAPGGVARGGLALIGGGGSGDHVRPQFAYAPQTTIITDAPTGPALQVGNMSQGTGINDVKLLIQDISFVGVETGLAILGSAEVRMTNVGAAARNWTGGRDTAGAVVSNTYWLSCDQCTFETVAPPDAVSTQALPITT